MNHYSFTDGRGSNYTASDLPELAIQKPCLRYEFYEVQDDSLKHYGYFQGDSIVIDTFSTIANGEIALIEDSCGWLLGQIFYNGNSSVCLLNFAVNTKRRFHRSEIIIIGRAVSVIRFSQSMEGDKNGKSTQS